MFKKIISSALACVMALGCALSCFAAQEGDLQVITTEISAPQKIIFLGDSIPAGFGLEGYTDNGVNPQTSYPSILESKYKKELEGVCDCKMINLAVSGDTSSQLWQKVGNGNFDTNLLASDVVVVSIGGNDIMEPILEFIYNDLKMTNKDQFKTFDTSKLNSSEIMPKLNATMEKVTANVATFKSNLAKTIQTLHKKTEGTLIIQTVYNPLDSNPSYATFSAMIGAKINDVNSIIKENAADNNYLVCDVAEAFKNKSTQYTNITDFDIHPNAEGHKVIADLVDQLVKQKKYKYEELKATINEVPDDSDSSSAKKMSKNEIYITLGLFFGGFFVLIVVVTIIFKKKTK